jgi:putative ABC transport system permease protein
VGVALWALDALLAAAPASVQQFADVRLSRAVLGFAAGLVVLNTFVFGLAPALQSTRLDLAQSLKDGGRDTGGPRAGRLRSGLVVAQVALSLMLLIGAALLLRSFAALLQVKPGFTTEGVIAAQISLGGPEYDEKQPAQARYWAEAVRRVAVLPGVTAAGAVNLPPLEGRTDSSYQIEGYVRGPAEPHTDDEFRQATEDDFKALGIAVVQGREFTAGDDAKSPLVALVNEAWVRRYFPGQEVIGRRLRFHGGEKEAPWRNIVGVVGDAHEFGFDKPTPPVYFVPLAQFAGSRATLMVRTAGGLQSLIKPVRQALAGIDPTQPVDRVDAFESHVEGALAARRFPLQLLGAFAGLALVLSALGIYGVTAYGVTQRTKEIGVRIAIGAQRTDVLRMVMSGAARLAAIGVGIGVFGALAGARLLSSQLYGVSARDPLIYAGISLLLALVALFASLLPALRASRVDPMSALRSE